MNLKNEIIFITIISSLFLIAGCTTTPDTSEAEAKYTQFANCLTESNAKMFGTEWCSHCNAQKAMFGEAIKDIDFIDCDKEKQLCRMNGITGYPTWVIDGKNYPGRQEFETLSKLTGCNLPAEE